MVIPLAPFYLSGSGSGGPLVQAPVVPVLPGGHLKSWPLLLQEGSPLPLSTLWTANAAAAVTTPVRATGTPLLLLGRPP